MPEPAEMGVTKMGVVLLMCESRGEVEPMTGYAVKVRTLGAEVSGCAPLDYAALLGNVGVPLASIGAWR
jgi:vancomycin aglycone glucosyltransferase